MNRWIQGSFAFVMAFAALSGVFAKEVKQLTDTESQQVAGSGVYLCVAAGNCECAGLPPPGPGISNLPCSGGCGEGNACRFCDSVGTYKDCVFYFFQTCTAASISCGKLIDGGLCGGPPEFRCAKVSTSTDSAVCLNSKCTLL